MNTYCIQLARQVTHVAEQTVKATDHDAAKQAARKALVDGDYTLANVWLLGIGGNFIDYVGCVHRDETGEAGERP